MVAPGLLPVRPVEKATCHLRGAVVEVASAGSGTS